MGAIDDLGTFGDDLKNTFFPRAQDVTKSPAYKSATDFATGIGNERTTASANRGSGTPTISESAAPAPPPGGQASRFTNGAGNNGVSTANPASTTQYADPTGKNAQNTALGLDESAAKGLAPSAAEQLYRKAVDEGMASQLGTAATLQGSNPGMALQSGLKGAADVATGSAAGGAALRANEMANARQDFGNLATQTRGQTQDLAKANQAASLQKLLVDNQFALGLGDEQLRAIIAQLGGAQSAADTKQRSDAANQAFLGKGIGALGTIAAG